MLLSALGAALGAVGSIVGGIGSAAKRRAQRKQTEKALRENEADYAKDYYGDYTQRSDIANLMKRWQDKYADMSKNSRQRQAVMGSSDSMVANEKEAGLKSIGNAMSTIAAQGSAVKDKAKSRYQSIKSDLLNQKAQNYAEAAGQWANVGANSAKLLSGALNSYMMKQGNGTASSPKSDENTFMQDQKDNWEYNPYR